MIIFVWHESLCCCQLQRKKTETFLKNKTVLIFVLQNVGVIFEPEKRPQVQEGQNRCHDFPAQLQVLGHPDDRLVHSCDVTAILR